MNDLPFETLLKANDSKDRWYPTPIDTLKYSVKIDMSIENARALHSNIAYNLQYIEFLEKELEELNLSSVVYIMVVKNYVITSMSIIEGLFTNIVKSNDWWKTSDLESLGTTQANETKFEDQKYIIKTELLKKVEPYNVQMNLDELIKILNRHHSALGVDHLIYPALKRLKDLRNRVHLQKTEGNTDHDYNAFDYSVKNEMSEILHDILTSPKITDRPKHLILLKANKKKKELTDFSKNQLALYFYNNSNNVAILLPQRAFKRRKAFVYGLFLGCDVIVQVLLLSLG